MSTCRFTCNMSQVNHLGTVKSGFLNPRAYYSLGVSWALSSKSEHQKSKLPYSDYSISFFSCVYSHMTPVHVNSQRKIKKI